jgi:hypothetical protein
VRNSLVAVAAGVALLGGCGAGLDESAVQSAKPPGVAAPTSSPLFGDLRELSSSMSSQDSSNNSQWSSYLATVPRPSKEAIEFAKGDISKVECPPGFAEAVAAGETAERKELPDRETAAGFLRAEFGSLPSGLVADTLRPSETPETANLIRDESIEYGWDYRIGARGKPDGTPTTWGDSPPSLQLHVTQAPRAESAADRVRMRTVAPYRVIDEGVLREGRVCGSRFLVLTDGSLTEARGFVNPWIYLAGPGPLVIAVDSSHLTLADVLQTAVDVRLTDRVGGGGK